MNRYGQWHIGRPPRAVRLLAGVVAVALVGLLGCGDGDDSSTAAPRDNACELLTTSDADELLGAATNGPSEDTDRSSGTYCEWVSEDSDDGSGASSPGRLEPYFVSVEHDRGPGAVQGYEFDKVDVSGPGDDASVSDLGDDAFYDDPNGLNVRIGDVVFSTYVGDNADHPLSADDRRAIERRAADLVADRIGEVDGGAAVEAAQECARTERCFGTRYRACDVLEDAEIARITGWEVADVDGTPVPTGSDRAGTCTFQLEEPNQGERDVRGSRRVEVFVDPDAHVAEQDYREARGDAEADGDVRELPELGPDAFYEETFDQVYVLEGGALLTLRYEVERPSGVNERSPATRNASIELADIARTRIEAD